MIDQAAIDRLNAEEDQLEDEIDCLMLELGKIELPPGTTRWRMIKCGKCEHLHGPYLYVYHRKDGHLEETYMSKDAEAALKISRAMELSKQVRAAIWKLGKVSRKLDRLTGRTG